MSDEVRATGDLTAFAVTLRRAASERGLNSTVADAIDLAHALSSLERVRARDLYLFSRAILVHRREDLAGFDLAFSDALIDFAEDPASSWSEDELPLHRAEVVLQSGGTQDTKSVARGMSLAPTLSFSAQERLVDRDIASCSSEELEMISAVLGQRARLTATRRRNRLLPTRHRATVIDWRRSLDHARSTEGEIIQLSFRARTRRWRRTVFLLDISGSMDPYAPTLLRMIWGLAQGAAPIEAFCLGTRLTRVTRMLAGKDRERAIAAIGAAVIDRSGGTRLGETMAVFNREFGMRGVARAANVVIFSDGLDRGDPELLGEQLARIARVAHRVIWVNPLKAGPGYAPRARGMQAAIGHVNHFIEGHSLGSLVALVDLLADDQPRDPIDSRFLVQRGDVLTS